MDAPVAGPVIRPHLTCQRPRDDEVDTEGAPQVSDGDGPVHQARREVRAVVLLDPRLKLIIGELRAGLLLCRREIPRPSVRKAARQVADQLTTPGLQLFSHAVTSPQRKDAVARSRTTVADLPEEGGIFRRHDKPAFTLEPGQLVRPKHAEQAEAMPIRPEDATGRRGRGKSGQARPDVTGVPRRSGVHGLSALRSGGVVGLVPHDLCQPAVAANRISVSEALEGLVVEGEDEVPQPSEPHGPMMLMDGVLSLACHKHDDINRWLAKNPRITLHFTPTSGSWLNLVEVFFGIITRQAIRRGSFDSVEQLVTAISTFIDGWNERCHPFIWTKTAEEILPHATRQTSSGA